MYDLVTQMLDITQLTIIIVATFSLWAGYILREQFDSSIVAVTFLPGFVVGALVSIYLFRQFGIVILPNEEANNLIATTVGLAGALILMFITMRITMFVTEARVRSLHRRRLADKTAS